MNERAVNERAGVAVRGAARLVVHGMVHAPGDKSISHRALILAALARGPSRVRNVLQSADVQATANALRALGVNIPVLSADMVIEGIGVPALRSPSAAVDCANSGTTTRLLAGLVAGLDGRSARFEGDASLSRRPMRRVATPLTAMGARIEFEGPMGHDGLPVRVFGARLHPVVWHSEHASAQIKSAILLAALASGTGVEVHEPTRSRDHTERMLAARGVALDVFDTGVRLAPDQTIGALDVSVPSDSSSAAFFVALAALADDGSLCMTDVCLNPTRTGAFDVLRRMGAAIEFNDQRDIGGEVTGNVIAHASSLVGTRIGGALIPRCIDELPLLACVASRAHGETLITDAGELRVKESDRITAVVDNLRMLGVEADELPDGLRILGSRRPLRGQVSTHGDHRLAMAFGILAALPGNSIVIDDPGCVSVSYPTFWRDLARVVGSASVSALSASVDGAHPTVVAELARPAVVADGTRAPLVIAIDGPAAAGKSSTAQWVAQQLGVRHVDSGAFYRALTYVALERAVRDERDAPRDAPQDAPQDAPREGWTGDAVLRDAHRVTWRLTRRSVLPLVDGRIVDDALRGAEVTRHVSQVAQLPVVRDWVNAQVREAAATTDVVVDGRDIGTAVFPGAPLKIFLIADPWERARRRLVQRLGRSPSDFEIAEETEDLVHRDAQDATQSAPARDAVTIDTTSLTQEEQVERIVALARATRDRLER